MRVAFLVIQGILNVMVLFCQLNSASEMVEIVRREFKIGDEWKVDNLEDCFNEKSDDYLITVERRENIHIEGQYVFYYTINYGIDKVVLLKIAQRDSYYVYSIEINNIREREIGKFIHYNRTWYDLNTSFGQKFDEWFISDDTIVYEIKSNFIWLILVFRNDMLEQIKVINSPD
jgi:hypothetical protein